MSPSKNVLLLKSKDVDVVPLQEALQEHAKVTEVANLAHLSRLLAQGDYDVLFCGSEITDGTWHDAFNEVQRRSSELPIVIVARLGGEKQWIDVLGQGAFDMVTAPYQMRTLLYLLEHAAASKQARASQLASDGGEFSRPASGNASTVPKPPDSGPVAKWVA
jgi:DNA-binding NtrC family response regulator